MTPMRDHAPYLAEEVAHDHADGLMTRRDALRQLGLMGFGVVGASALLAGCGSDDDTASATTTTTTTTAAPSPGPAATPARPAVATQAVTYAGTRGQLQGAWAPAATARGAVLVVHENRGLTDHIRSIAGRLAADGYSALAVDLLSEEGGTAGVENVPTVLGAKPVERLVDDMVSTVDELERRQRGAKLGTVGFGFGGTMTWLMVENEPRLAAAAPFYGQVRTGVDFPRGKAAVLGVYAELDGRVNGTRDQVKAALDDAGLPNEIRTFPGVDHAFFDDTGPRYNETQAAAAYAAVLDWFGRHLG